MADWTTITETATDPDAPVTSSLLKALRDNPIAIAEGASGATRIDQPAMGTWLYTAGGVGTMAFLAIELASGSSISHGSTRAGSLLEYAGVKTGANGLSLSGVSPSGTWRLMGYLENSTGANLKVASTWIRIS